MKVKLIIISIILLLIMVFACGCIPFMEKIGLINPTNEEQLSPEKGGPPDGLVKVLIGFKEKPGAAQQAMVRGVGGKIKYTYNIVDAIAASIPEKAIEALQKNPNIRYVETDGQVYALDDELNNTWGVKRIGAGFVHDDGNKGAEVKVAIIDSGIDYNHPDLDDNYAGGYDFVNDDDDPMDDDGHGTHVAGTVAAEDNGEGVVGVAPEAFLYALKVLDETGRGYVSDIVAAIEWATDPNGDEDTSDRLDIINMSLGGGANSTLEDACLSAYNEELLLVAAAGNSGNPPGRGDNIIYPAAYDSVIAVAATDQNDVRARWSSTGPDLELSAPGVAINSTLLGGGYGEGSGTSMASPHVAGTAALVMVVYPLWSNKEVREQLKNTADDLGDPEKHGYGLVNAAEAADVDTPLPGAIAGKVTDTDNNIAIVGAKVVVEDTDLSATTDSSGYYEITDVAEGTYTVTASADGYESDSQENVTVSADAITSDVDFALYPLSSTGTMYVESITFSAKKAGKNLFLYTTVDVSLKDNGAVDGARVTMTLTDGTSFWNFSSDTGSDGAVKFTLKAQAGNYTATVTEVSHPDYAWDEDIMTKNCQLYEDGTVVQQ